MTDPFQKALDAVAFFCGEVSASAPTETMIAAARQATGFDVDTIRTLFLNAYCWRVQRESPSACTMSARA